jgi:hypothetical protein
MMVEPVPWSINLLKLISQIKIPTLQYYKIKITTDFEVYNFNHFMLQWIYSHHHPLKTLNP